MMSQFSKEFCRRVRDALLSESFDDISRKEVEEHLASHPACAEWTSQLVSLAHILSGKRGSRDFRTSIDETQLEAYVNGALSARERELVEEVNCHDLGVAARLTQLRHQRLQHRIEKMNGATVLRVVDTVAAGEKATLAIDLEAFRQLYFHKPEAVAAAQSQRSTFQTPDGRLVVSVVDKGADRPGAPHLVELAIRAHEPQWIGQWACYRILDAEGKMASAGLICVEEHGSSVVVSLPQTEHAPYKAHVQILGIGNEELKHAIEKLIVTKDKTDQIDPPAGSSDDQRNHQHR